MTKVTLDINSFKALASETRLNILRNLDGKKMSLNDLINKTDLNKATLYEHLLKLNEAGLVNRIERKGHKWVYYKLSWKGSSLLHPENSKIVIMFSLTFLTLFVGIVGLINYLSTFIFPTQVRNGMMYSPKMYDTSKSLSGSEGGSFSVSDPFVMYLTIGCLIIFSLLVFFTYKKYNSNKIPKI